MSCIGRPLMLVVFLASCSRTSHLEEGKPEAKAVIASVDAAATSPGPASAGPSAFDELPPGDFSSGLPPQAPPPPWSASDPCVGEAVIPLRWTGGSCPAKVQFGELSYRARRNARTLEIHLAGIPAVASRTEQAGGRCVVELEARQRSEASEILSGRVEIDGKGRPRVKGRYRIEDPLRLLSCEGQFDGEGTGPLAVVPPARRGVPVQVESGAFVAGEGFVIAEVPRDVFFQRLEGTRDAQVATWDVLDETGSRIATISEQPFSQAMSLAIAATGVKVAGMDAAREEAEVDWDGRRRRVVKDAFESKTHIYHVERVKGAADWVVAHWKPKPRR